eukprot:Nk52_evm69s230 gene=Nk52_evmTU69s230
MSTKECPPNAQTAYVKLVQSADTVILRGRPIGGPPKERTLSFAGLTAPRLGRKGNQDGTGATDDEVSFVPCVIVSNVDIGLNKIVFVVRVIDVHYSFSQPFAWDCREALRRKIIGKEVKFTVEYKVPSGREYGCIWLGKENITQFLISNGWAKIREQTKGEKSEFAVELEALSASAQSQEKGLFSKDSKVLKKAVRKINTISDPRQFYEQNKGKQINAVVEHMRDGSSYRLYLLPEFYHIQLSLTGIKCPTFKRGNDGVDEPEPFAEEAKFFAESRLLQKDVQVVLEGVSNNMFMGSLIHPAGNISEFLVTEGLARCVDWSMSMVVTGKEKLRAAEKAAKLRRVRLWKNYAPNNTGVEGGMKEFKGTVVEIANGETIVVKVPDQENMRITLSSIRQPRSVKEALDQEKKENKKGQRSLYTVPYLFEAREFLRKRLIGKKVNVIVDYIKPASDGFEAKTCCTVCIDSINIAEALVSKGYATVLRHRNDDDNRSSHYDDLLVAEARAIKSKKGLHSNGDLPVHRVSDLSADSAKARQFFPFLERAAKLTGIVEFVSSGSRLKLYLPKETCLITFLLGGISCPRAPNANKEGGEPFGAEALEFTWSKVYQREVDIEVESMDKNGNCVGTLFVNGKNLNVDLVAEGLAKVHFSADRSPYSRDLYSAEESAMDRFVRLWHDYKEEEKVEVVEKKERTIDYKETVVVEVEEAFKLWVQYLGPEADELDQLMASIEEHYRTNPPVEGSFTPKSGEMCASCFTDNVWYRAKVVRVVSLSEIQVFYVDYGNSETVGVERLTALPMEFRALRPQAKEVYLALIAKPPTAEWEEEAVRYLRDACLNAKFVANHEYSFGGKDYVTMTDPESKTDLSEMMLNAGLAVAERTREQRFKTIAAKYKSLQEAACKKRVNMWEYGDITADDDREFGYKPVAEKGGKK